MPARARQVAISSFLGYSLNALYYLPAFLSVSSVSWEFRASLSFFFSFSTCAQIRGRAGLLLFFARQRLVRKLHVLYFYCN